MDATTLVALASPASAAIGALAKVAWDRWHASRTLSVQAKAVEADDESQIRKDLIAERKMLLDQLIEERKFYLREMTNLRGEVSNLRSSIATLQQENRDKDDKIREQQGKIDEQARLITALRTELDELKSHESHNPA
jgi:hypothetical protein